MNKITTIIIIAITSFFYSCSKDEIIGSEITRIAGPVTIIDSLKVNDDTIDFAIGERPYFMAKFENEVYWEITLTSGNAYKTLTGGTNEISAINSLWDGSSDAVFSFNSGVVQVTLSFPKSSNKPVLNSSFYIKSKPNLNFKGLKITDFSTVPVAGPDSPIDWASDWQPTGQYDGLGTPPTGGEAMGDYPILELIDGTPALIMAGNPWGQGPYIDFIDLPARSINSSWSTFPLLPEANRVYFNLFIYHDKAKMSDKTQIDISFFDELDRSISTTFIPNWTGWKLCSINMESLIKNNNLTSEAYLPVDFKVHKIKKIQFVLLSTDENLLDPVKTIIDNIIFTYDKPFQP